MTKQRSLPNNVTLTYFDESRKIAADRWLIKIRCLATVPLQDWMIDLLSGDDDKTTYCREQFNGYLTYETIMERNFIDESEVPVVTAQLFESFDENTLRYLSKQEFVKNLFHSLLAEYSQRFLLQDQIGQLPDIDEEESGPVDFSDCFK